MSYKSNVSKADRTTEAVDFPSVVLIDNCNACNLKCSMCDHKNIANHRKIQIMDMVLYKKIIDEIAVKNPAVRIWEIFFGDPFLCKDMPARIKYAKDKGLADVVLNTNGVLMTGKNAFELIRARLDSIYVGIDAATEKTYNKIRVGGNFNKVVENVLNYRNLLHAYGWKDQKIFVQFVISNINEDEVEDFKNFWKTEKVNVKIRPKVSWAGLVEAENLLSNESVTRKPCYWLMRTINICADGEAALCSVDIHCKVKCGNINEKAIEDVWCGQLKGYRDMHRENRFNELPELCRNCSDWQSAYAEFY